MHFFVRFIDCLSEQAGRLCAWLFFAIGLFVCFDVVMRYFFNAPTIWVDEVSRILQIWATFLAAGYVLKHGEMITIDIAFRNRHSLSRRLAETLALVMLFIFAGTAIWFGFQEWLKATMAGHTTDSFLAPPKWLTHASIWVGCGLLFLQGLAALYRIWSDKNSQDEPETGHDRASMTVID